MTERHCKECTLCCKLVPVPQLSKPANTRCQFQRLGKGCTVHSTARFPTSCALWGCVWLYDASADLPRPDRAHYVVDPTIDFVELEVDGVRHRVDVVQVWLDPKYPDAHRDPKLRAYLTDRAQRRGHAALIRLDASRGFVLFPPPMTSSGEWFETRETEASVPDHTAAEIHRSRMR